MINILFVCHGNICRSPMAEFIMRRFVAEAGLEREISVASAATSAEEIGNPVYPPVRQLLGGLGISCKGKTAVRMTRSDYERYDFLVGMDNFNRRNMLRICGNDSEGKISLLMDYTSHPRDVADPWYSRDFDAAYRDIDEGCRALLNHIIENCL